MPDALPTPRELVLMGRCGRAHGIRGEVKVHPETDDPGRFADLDRVFVGPAPADVRVYTVESVRYQFPKGEVVVLLGLEEVEGRDGAEALVHQRVYAAVADLPPLAEDEIYVHDLIGMAVVEVDEAGEPVGEPLGAVRDVFDGLAQDLVVVAREGRPDVLVPDVPEIVVGVDEAGRRLFVRPPEGLFD
jgi:16S rRNA processing protein RimM